MLARPSRRARAAARRRHRSSRHRGDGCRRGSRAASSCRSRSGRHTRPPRHGPVKSARSTWRTDRRGGGSGCREAWRAGSWRVRFEIRSLRQRSFQQEAGQRPAVHRFARHRSHGGPEARGPPIREASKPWRARGPRTTDSRGIGAMAGQRPAVHGLASRSGNVGGPRASRPHVERWATRSEFARCPPPCFAR